ncbi:histone H1 [Artemisia annua]|uniref:Histone H1 n=1 Tax=Artemisia annua TaxID=35608 RepID=A0A2U1MZL3_ARTAN|nr:histone H1 [Artemisia annua]
MSTEEPIVATTAICGDAPLPPMIVIHSKAKKSLALRKHPPYLEMVSDAIVTLKERNGSSQYAIRKFIEEKHKDLLPVNFKKMLLNQLRKLVASGKLVKVKASYKLPSAAKTVGAAKRKKGAAPAKKKPTAPATFSRHGKHSSAPIHIRHLQIQPNLPDELAQPETTNRSSMTLLTIKATYKKDMVRFSFKLSDGFINLKEQIATRFQLELGSFSLKYIDEDGDMILVTCDSSLSVSVDDFRLPDGRQTAIRLVVFLLVN